MAKELIPTQQRSETKLFVVVFYYSLNPYAELREAEYVFKFKGRNINNVH